MRKIRIYCHRHNLNYDFLRDNSIAKKKKKNPAKQFLKLGIIKEKSGK